MTDFFSSYGVLFVIVYEGEMEKVAIEDVSTHFQWWHILLIVVFVVAVLVAVFYYKKKHNKGRLTRN